MNPLVVIPARGGSKGIPNKNIKLLGGKPLIWYTIEAAREVFSDDQICISTDSIEIKEKVEETGLKIPFIRPAELATDTSGTYEVLLHAIKQYEAEGKHFDSIVLLQPTSPFRTAIHIKEAIDEFTKTLDCEMLVSVKETKANPYYIVREENHEGWLIKSKEGNYTRRQDCPKAYELNGAVYVIRTDVLKKKNFSEFTRIKKYLMAELSSHDIDTKLDWMLAETILSYKKEQNES